MNPQLIPALRFRIALLALCGMLCPALVRAAQAAPSRNAASQPGRNSRVSDLATVGQQFDKPGYFHLQPLAADYHAAARGSGKRPFNPGYLETVPRHLSAFAQQSPAVATGQVPTAPLMASGPGLGPYLSPAGALVQVARVARVRGLPQAQVRALVARYVEKPLFAFFGPAKVHVLPLNLALDSLAAR